MSWTCSSCTFINDNDAAVCEICAQKRSDYWLCSSCTYGCPLSSSKCTVCGALRPEGNKSTIQQLEGSEISRRQKRKECEYCNDDDESKRSSQVGAVEIKMRSGAYAFEEDYADGYNNFDISDQHKLNYHSRFPYDITTPHPSYKPTGSATIDANQTISAPESLDNDLVMENTKLSLQVQYVDEPTSLYSKVPKSSVSEKGSSMKRAKSLVTLENQQLTGKLSHEEVVTIIDEQLEPSILSSLIVLLNSCEPKMLYSVQAMPHATSLAWARVPLNVNVHSNTSINQVQTFKNCMNTGTNTMESVSSTTSLGKSLVQLCVPRIELAGVLYDKSTLARQHVGVLNNMNGNCNIELGALLPFSPIASLHQSSSPNESPSTSPTFGASSAPLSPSLTPSSQFPMWGPTVIICLKALDICKVYSPPKNGSAPKSTNNGTENLLKFLTRGASFYPIQRVTFIIEGLLSIIQRKLNRKKQKLIETAEEGVDRNESEQMLIRRARLAAIRQDAILELVPFQSIEDATDVFNSVWFQSSNRFRIKFLDGAKQVSEYLFAVAKVQAKEFYRKDDSLLSLVGTSIPTSMKQEVLSKSPSPVLGVLGTNRSWVKFLMQIPGFSEAKSSDFVYVYKTLQQTLGIIRKARSNAIVERNLKENHSWGTDTKDPAVELLANTVLATANRKLGKVLATRLCHALTSDDSELLLKE